MPASNDQLLQPEWPEMELVGWLLLLSVVLVATHAFGMFIWVYGANDLLERLPHAPAGDAGIHSLVAVIEVALIPLTTVVAAWTRIGAERIRGLRNIGIGPWLPLIMAISIIGLATYMWWTLVGPQPRSGPEQFTLARWLGAALAVAFTIIWLPLFPRLMSILAGMIAGPFVVAVIGYLLFGSVFADLGSQFRDHEGWGIFAPIASLFAAQLGLFVLLRNKLSLLWAGSIGVAAIFEATSGFGLFWFLLLPGWALVGMLRAALRAEQMQIRAKPAICFVVCALAAGGLTVSVAWF